LVVEHRLPVRPVARTIILTLYYAREGILFYDADVVARERGQR
jgi:hypothetical protein